VWVIFVLLPRVGLCKNGKKTKGNRMKINWNRFQFTGLGKMYKLFVGGLYKT